ncbi:MAG: hypothetical protein QNJ78_15335 [Gammaproteobacteria bacterium]|nr:hypothetical protein [Gammaproteobacteria bacterium]
MTHTELAIDEAGYAKIRATFYSHLREDGAHFMKPQRIDLLQKPLKA